MVGAVTLDKAWLADVLQGINAPVTDNNSAILSEWARHEGGTAAWNFMNTTRPADGTTDYNNIHMANGGVIHVKNYPSESVGAAMTAQTLVNGHYWDVVNLLRANAPLCAWHTATVRNEISTWGTHGFAKELS